jgi:hypothetical protein
MTGDRINQDMRNNGPQPSFSGCCDKSSGFQQNLNTFKPSRAISFFKDAAEAEGNRRTLTPNELMEQLDTYAPDGVQSRDSFIRMASDLGFPRDAAVRVYQQFADENGGIVENGQILDYMLPFADRNGNWNIDQFGEGLESLAQDSEPSDDQVGDAFTSLSGGGPTLTPDMLRMALEDLARGSRFSQKELSDLGALLGLEPDQSGDIFNGLKSVLGRSPTVDDIMGFASGSADSRGNWNIRQFRDVANRLVEIPDMMGDGGNEPMVFS